MFARQWLELEAVCGSQRFVSSHGPIAKLSYLHATT